MVAFTDTKLDEYVDSAFLLLMAISIRFPKTQVHDLAVFVKEELSIKCDASLENLGKFYICFHVALLFYMILSAPQPTLDQYYGGSLTYETEETEAVLSKHKNKTKEVYIKNFR